MNPSTRYWLISIGICLMMAAAMPCGADAALPMARNGVLDLRAWDPDTDGPLPLSGEWHFTWGSLLSPEAPAPAAVPPARIFTMPGVWNDREAGGQALGATGCATFSLKILLPPEAGPLAVDIPRIFSAYRLWVDARLVSEAGIVSCEASSMRPDFTSAMARAFPDNTGQATLTLQIANFTHAKGGIRQAIRLGRPDAISAALNRTMIVEALLAGALLILALYHLSLFAFRKEDLINLYFSLICLLCIIRNVLTGSMIGKIVFPWLPWALSVKFEWLVVYAGPFLGICFFQSQFPDDGSARISRAGIFFAAVLSLFVMAAPPMVFTRLFQWTIPIIVALLAYCIAILTRALARKRRGALSFAIAFGAVFIATVNDILNASEVIQTGFYLPYGLLFFIIALSIQLSTRSSFALRQVEIQAGLLEHANEAYRAEIRERQRAEAAVGAYQEKLEELVANRTRALEETNQQLATELEDRHRAEAEKERLQRQLQRAQKMEAVGTLAGGVAHDLNNILSGLVGYPELLLMDLPAESHLRKPIEIIMKSGHKAAAIVQDLLTLARRGVHDAAPVDLNAVVRDYLDSPEFRKLIEFHPGVSVETDLAPDLLPLEGSPVHLAKVVMNLVSNAAEAMPDGGCIHVRTRNTFLDSPLKGYEITHPGDYVLLETVDNGIGMKPEELERVFEPFYSKKKLGRSGTGLGLAVVWGTVKDHRGYINAKSTPERGTAFTLYFPVSRKPLEEALAREASPAYGGHGEMVLVVDDMSEQRKLAVVMLQKLGYAAEAVSSGEAAVTFVRKQKVDVLLLDMIMDPGIDGLETYRRIIHIHPDQKAVIASGYAETERVKEARQLGAGVYVRKPYTLETIGKAVHQVLHG